ncbi:PREDICTED: uncharacterized protein LOC108564678 [Nicrophorus vespilloides]|uniref:Uncharacterized protein LOC108564678 n=1 Tax=Nicrophorus vespilloides TaxID=110193 RepID=A0ABM1MXF5_NICVS|nr:PREDICTED: uncharacterized protein LOC108564678 [Nicrophorus vespilloides]
MRCADGIKIAKIERINRKVTSEDGGFSYVPTNSVIVTFGGKRMPKSVYMYYNSRPIETYVPRVIQCFGCLRCGHTKAICKSPSIRCPACAKDHPLDMCPDRDAPVCLHCGGNHLTNEQNKRLAHRTCPEYLRQKAIKSNMVNYQCLFFETDKLSRQNSQMKAQYRIAFPDTISRQVSLPSERPASNKKPFAQVARSRSPPASTTFSVSSARNIAWDHSYEPEAPKRKIM